MNLLPILTSQIKARACVWAEEGKGGARGLREWEQEERKWRKKRWKEDGAEPHGLEKPQVARDLIGDE